jgi:hypothetical protein
MKKMIKPVIRGTIRTSVRLVVDARRAAHEFGEDLSDIAAEASVEAFASDVQEGGAEVPRQTAKKPRPSKAHA